MSTKLENEKKKLIKNNNNPVISRHRRIKLEIFKNLDFHQIIWFFHVFEMRRVK